MPTARTAMPPWVNAFSPLAGRENLVLLALISVLGVVQICCTRAWARSSRSVAIHCRRMRAKCSRTHVMVGLCDAFLPLLIASSEVSRVEHPVLKHLIPNLPINLLRLLPQSHFFRSLLLPLLSQLPSTYNTIHSQTEIDRQHRYHYPLPSTHLNHSTTMVSHFLTFSALALLLTHFAGAQGQL